MIASFNYTPSEDSAWRINARCRDLANAPDMFPNGQDDEAVEEARRFCRGCPVIIECLEDAIRRGEQHGIWGGMDMRERTVVRRNRTRTTLKQRKEAREAAERLSDDDTAALDGAA